MGGERQTIPPTQVTRMISHPFCMAQYASFQTAEYLYFLFDHLSGGDLMDRLAAQAKICSIPQVHKRLPNP